MPHTATPLTPLLPDSLERLAQKRAQAKLGFYTHAFIYAVVITGLSLLAFSQGKGWSLWPAAGWGVGLLMHALGVFGFSPRSKLRERLTERERQALRAQLALTLAPGGASRFNARRRNLGAGGDLSA